MSGAGLEKYLKSLPVKKDFIELSPEIKQRLQRLNQKETAAWSCYESLPKHCYITPNPRCYPLHIHMALW